MKQKAKKRVKFEVNRRNFFKWLKRSGACAEALALLKRTKKTPRELFETLDHNPDWLVWLYAEASADLDGVRSQRVDRKFSRLDNGQMDLWLKLKDRSRLRPSDGDRYCDLLEEIDKKICKWVRTKLRWSEIVVFLKKNHRESFTV